MLVNCNWTKIGNKSSIICSNIIISVIFSSFSLSLACLIKSNTSQVSFSWSSSVSETHSCLTCISRMTTAVVDRGCLSWIWMPKRKRSSVQLRWLLLAQFHSDLNSRVAPFLNFLAALNTCLHFSFQHWRHWSSHFCEDGRHNLKILTFEASIILCSWIDLRISVMRAGTV